MDAARQPNIAFELTLLLALATLWGGSYTFIKLGVATIPPITLIAARTAIAGVLLVMVMRLRGTKCRGTRRPGSASLSRLASTASSPGR
jgi:drug/metabolite transporter (DMT)-like permease